MIDAAKSDGGYPMGVHNCLLSGRIRASGCSLEIYTIDPSGGCRSSIGKGTAVGDERVSSPSLCSTHNLRIYCTGICVI